jgi:hypothetical protein
MTERSSSIVGPTGLCVRADGDVEGRMIIFQAEDQLSRESLVVVVIEQDNFERMVEIRKRSGQRGQGDHWSPCNIPTASVVAFEKESRPVYEFLRPQDRVGLLRYLLRGYRIKSTDCVPSDAGNLDQVHRCFDSHLFEPRCKRKVRDDHMSMSNQEG